MNQILGAVLVIKYKLQQITRPGIIIIHLKLADLSIICVWTYKNDPELFNICLTQIPIF